MVLGSPRPRLCDLQDVGPRLRLGRRQVSCEKGLSLSPGACKARTGVRIPLCVSPTPEWETRLTPWVHEGALSAARVPHAVLSVVARERGKRKRGFTRYVLEVK